MSKDKTPQFPGMPQITVNKNGFEIRSDILSLAQNAVMQEYHYKLGEFEAKAKGEGGKMVTTVTYPPVPGMGEIMAAAEKFYGFVAPNNNNKK